MDGILVALMLGPVALLLGVGVGYASGRRLRVAIVAALLGLALLAGWATYVILDALASPENCYECGSGVFAFTTTNAPAWVIGIVLGARGRRSNLRQSEPRLLRPPAPRD